MRVTVRRPDGGEAVLPLDRVDSVAQLRAIIQWCVENNDWNADAIPRSVKQQCSSARAAGKAKSDDEMWTLNEQVDAGHSGDDPDALEDLESSHRHANRAEGDVIEGEAGRIEIMHGPVVLRDGYTLSEYGIEDGSFLHPLYTLRGGGGKESLSGTWEVPLAQLPWSDREWYRSGTSSALASVAAWWGGASESVAATLSMGPASAGASQGPSVPAKLKFASDEQLPGVFGATVLGGEDSDNAAL
jgi:hypothetical protein